MTNNQILDAVYCNTIHFILIVFLSIYSCGLLAQSNDVWSAFWNKDSTLVGFKDNDEVIKIAPRFSGFIRAKRFDNIIAVAEVDNEKWDTYYLTKAGKVVGKDSLYIYDNGTDCENEGFIRFRDNKGDKVGVFDRTGKVVVPAIYNALTIVRNGMIIALKDAEKEYWDLDRHGGCDHYSWRGGQEVLIDTTNKVLVENFSNDNSLNFYSLEKTATPHPDTIRSSFLGTDGTYYSFVDFEKEFKQWLFDDLLVNFTADKLVDASIDSIMFFEGKNGWVNSKKEKFVKNNFLVLKGGLMDVLQSNCDYSILQEQLNPYMFEGVEFEKYFNTCGEAKYWLYPVLSIIVSQKDKNDFSQDHYEFLRTEDGYKLICVSVKGDKLK